MCQLTIFRLSYTRRKGFSRRTKVQDKLKELGVPYRKFEAYLDSEKLFQIVYEIQILGG